MSYSDYGGFCWRNNERFTPGEDATLAGAIAPGQDERPLQAATGLKLDVLLNAQEIHGTDPEAPLKPNEWETTHPHHAVLGHLLGLAIVGYKQRVTIMQDGEVAQRFPEDNDPLDHYALGTEIRGVGNDGTRWAAHAVHYPHSAGVIFGFQRVDGTLYTAVTGYGVGDHWWKDTEGYELRRPGEVRQQWGDLGCSVHVNEKLRAREMARYKLKSEWAFVGRWPNQVPWPTYEQWAARVKEWAVRSIC